MQIILMRHGKPEVSRSAIKAKEFSAWIATYNAADLCADSLPSAAATRISRQAQAVICSNLARSVNSAKRLALVPTAIDPLLREMEMPYRSFLSPALPPKIWALAFRLAWFAGFSANAETFSQAKLRASDAVVTLIHYAQQHGKIIFIGHGLLNRYIAKALLSRGWEGPSSPGKNHWEYGVYNYAN